MGSLGPVPVTRECVKGSLSYSGQMKWGLGCPPWASSRAKMGGCSGTESPWPWSLVSGWQEGESRPMPVSLGQRPLRGRPTPRSPPPQAWLLFPLQ